MVHNNYDWEQSATALIKDLNWENLSSRRKIIRLSILHKAIGGHLALPVNNYLRPSQRSTRSSNLNSYIPISCRINAHKWSFVPQTIRDWNELPLNITDIESPTQFKNAVTKLIIKQDSRMD